MRVLPVTRILDHSIKSTINNIGFAFHVSWPWMLAILPFIVAGNVYALLNQPMPGKMAWNVALVNLGVGLLTMVAFASIAVSWHRYILLDEVPHGWRRLRLDATVWRYIGNTFLMILAIVAAAIPVGIVAAILVALMGKYSLVLVIPLYAALVFGIVVYSYRLGIKLPGVALERRDYGFRNALADSDGNFWRFLGLGVLTGLIMLGIALAVGVPAYLIMSAQSQAMLYVLIAVQLVVNWAATIWTVTMLTSLYGYFAERRNL